MRTNHVERTIHQCLRVSVGAVVISTMALSGLFIGPAPGEARGALVATAINDSYAVKHDRLAVIPAPGVLANDLNLLGGASAILVSNVSHGTLNLRSDGGFTYTPAARYVGPDTFRYRPSGLLSTAATVTITVTNATPVARPDGYSWPAGSTLVVAAPGVLANDADADGDALVTEMVGGGISGSLTLDANGALRYTPGGGFSGTATFSYRVWDGVAWSAATTVSLNSVAPTPTPTPRPTLTPSPAPTATPQPTATPTLPAPLPTPTVLPPLPGAPLPPLPLPGASQPTSPASATASPSGSPGATQSPGPSPGATRSPAPSPGATLSPAQPPGTSRSSAGSATASPRQSDSSGIPSDATVGAPPARPGTGGGPSSPSGGSTDAGSGDPGPVVPSIGFDEKRLELGGASVGIFAGIDVWAVPAATIAGPGLLVLVWVALQSAGAIAWMPAVRRLQGKDRRPTRARFRTRPS